LNTKSALEYSDDALAQRFHGIAIGRAAYIPEWGKWIVCPSDEGWKIDEHDYAIVLFIRDFCREEAKRCDDPVRAWGSLRMRHACDTFKKLQLYQWLS
jgi:hypothetical protein